MFAGVDIGSVTSKAVLLDAEGRLIAYFIVPTTYDRESCGKKALHMALQEISKTEEEITSLFATGYGRKAFSSANGTKSEILCHAVGTKYLISDVRTIIDIGGQDSKVIALDKAGMIAKFQMNDKCAAGTGRFLEILSERILNLKVEEIGQLSLKSEEPCKLSSVCTVFAESEIVSYLSAKKKRADIAYGLHCAIAKRVISMGRSVQIRFDEPICFSGGVARNSGVVRAIEEELGKSIMTPEEPQLTAALGAAIYAWKNAVPDHIVSP